MKESKVKYTRFNQWVWHYLPECKDIVKVITSSMDSKLTWRQWITLKIHLISCDPCVNFIKQVKFIRTVLRTGSEQIVVEDGSVALTDEARIRMKNALAESQPASE